MSQDSAWFLYIIETHKNTLYTGITTDVARRWQEHNDSSLGSKYLKARKPKALVYVEAQENRSMASKREAAIKSLSRIEKLELIESSQNELEKWRQNLEKS